MDKAIAADSFIGLVLLKSDEMENPGRRRSLPDRHGRQIVQSINLPDGGVNIFISTLKRFQVKKVMSGEFPIVTAVEYLDDDNFTPLR